MIRSGVDGARILGRTTPSRLRWAMLQHAVPPPAGEGGLGYVYAGEGAAAAAIVVAALHPSAAVWALDPDVGAVARAEAFFRRCGRAGPVVEVLGGAPERAPFEADYLVLDGILSSVCGREREAWLQWVGRTLSACGVAAVSCRTPAGWSEMVPLYRSVQVLAERFPGTPAERFEAVVHLLEQMKGGQARFVCDRSFVAGLLDDWTMEEPELAAAEVLGGGLFPVSAAGLDELMAAIDCRWVGPLEPSELAWLTVPEGLRHLRDELTDHRLREVVFELACRTNVRSVIFAREHTVLPSAQRDSELGAVALAAWFVPERDRFGVELESGVVTLPSAPFAEALRRAQPNASVAASFDGVELPDDLDVALAASLLVDGGFAHPLGAIEPSVDGVLLTEAEVAIEQMLGVPCRLDPQQGAVRPLTGPVGSRAVGGRTA